MTEPSTQIAGADAPPLPEVTLELRQGANRSSTINVSHVDFLVGSVPGCDLRVPGVDLPPVLCLIARRPGGLTLRKLAPTLVILVNGQTASNADLAEGDRITLGAVDIFVRRLDASAVSAATAPAPAPELQEHVVRFQAEREAFTADQQESLVALAQREKELQERSDELEKERHYWYERRAELQKEVADNEAAVALAKRIVPEELDQRDRQIAAKEQQLAEGEAELQRQRQDIAKVRQELADIRQELYQRYQERRDRLSGLQEAVDRAAKKVQERKRAIDAEAQQHQQQLSEHTALTGALEKRTGEFAHRVGLLEQERQRLQERHEQAERDHEARLADLRQREQKLTLDQRQYQTDVLRLDRRQGEVEERARQFDERNRQIDDKVKQLDERFAQLQKESADLEEQVRQADEWRTQLQDQAERLDKQKADQQALDVQLIQRSAALEGQQATFATLRTRLERQRDEMRRQEMQLEEQRLRQEKAEEELREHLQQAQKTQAELEAEGKLREQERQQLLERQATLDAAVGQMRQAQDKAAQDERRYQQLAQDVELRQTELADKEALVESRLRQLAESQERLDAERQALRERTTALAQAEQVREQLQDQLRKRSEELSTKQKTLTAQSQRLETETAGLQQRRAELEALMLQIEEQRGVQQEELEARSQAIEQQRADLLQREEQQRRQQDQIKDMGRDLGGQSKALAEERAAWEQEQRDAEVRHERTRAELDVWRRDVQVLMQQLPDVELRAGASLDKLGHAREQLRDHLAEVHTYVRQCQEHLEAFGQRLHDDLDKLRQRELDLHTQQDEQRLALAAFRQQLIDWQGQVADMQRSLNRDGTLLQRRQARVEEHARQVDATSQELTQKTEVLKQEQKAVAQRRQEVDRHLDDMREWYRHKLRELAGADLGTPTSDTAPSTPNEDEGEEAPILPMGRHILSLTDPVDPGDHKLGELLRTLELVEGDTLQALLAEARRQRRSLRQVLLASGVLTLYQLALIETGNVDALMLGPVRILDRLKVTPREAVYRVFDPRRNQEGLLRHLAEEEMADAVHPDEFRQRFAQARIANPHLAGTVEVLDIAGRPAVLLEWLTALPSSDWPPLAAVPGVCYRLLTQAALGLGAAHQHGLIHGHLHESHILLTADGAVKITGLGEPAWLTGQTARTESPKDDLQTLGRIVAGWCATTAVRRGAKAKPLPDALSALLDQLQAGAFETAEGLLAELDRAGSDLPANAEAWDRLLRHVREHAGPEALLRQSA